MRTPTARSRPARTSRRPLGLPIWAIGALALLGTPRVILHDLGMIAPGTFANALLVFVPVIVWIAVAIAARVPRPFLTLLAIGACYGVLLAIGHQLLWGASFPDGGPSLGGSLSGLDPTAQVLLFRLVAVISSLVTGLIVGVLSGLVAELVHLVLRRTRRAA